MNYWLMANGDVPRIKEEHLAQNLIGMGWNVGDLSNVKSKEEIQALADALGWGWDIGGPSCLALWQFSHEMAIGDIVYIKEGLHAIAARGIITSDYIYDPSREYHDIRRVEWTHREIKTKVKQSPRKTLTKYDDPKRIRELEALYGIVDTLLEVDELLIDEPEVAGSYTKKDFLAEVYISETEYKELTSLLKRKKNVILQGAPGVGKTFAAKRLAYAIMGIADKDQVKMIQFHQSYSYEDFVMGYRPDGDGFSLKEGPFYQFCQKAREDEESDYFFIIDEINRGNMSKIFGELLMLIEDDKRRREYAMPLMYANGEEDEGFYIPENLYIIGMMNTADRSLAMIDYALRRRFAFFDMTPAFEKDGFITYQQKVGNSQFNQLIAVVKDLNEAIREDDSLGSGFEIGHSHFCTLLDEDGKPKSTIDVDLSGIVTHELIPLLREYWFDDSTKVKGWSEKLQSAIG